jgi:hypothetical protein
MKHEGKKPAGTTVVVINLRLNHFPATVAAISVLRHARHPLVLESSHFEDQIHKSETQAKPVSGKDYAPTLPAIKKPPTKSRA